MNYIRVFAEETFGTLSIRLFRSVFPVPGDLGGNQFACEMRAAAQPLFAYRGQGCSYPYFLKRYQFHDEDRPIVGSDGGGGP